MNVPLSDGISGSICELLLMGGSKGGGGGAGGPNPADKSPKYRVS